MYFKTFSDILHNECANCAKSLNDDFGHNSRDISRTSLLFTDIQFSSSLVEDITNFQAISYIYGVPASVLETNIKKYLIILMRQKKDKNSPGDRDPDNSEADDPLSSLNLTLCQNCSKIISELYTSFYKFEKLSHKKSIIAKGVQYSKEKAEFQDIKLDLPEVEINKNTTKKFAELKDEKSQDLEQFQFELDSIKEEIESDDSQFVFHEVHQDQSSGGEDNNYDSEDAEPLHGVHVDVKIDKTQHSYGIRPRRTRKQILTCKANETDTDGEDSEIDNNEKTENFAESSDEDFSECSEESDWFEEAADGQPSKSPAKRKSTTSKTRGRRKSKSGKSDKTSTLRYKKRIFGHYSLKCFICKKYFHRVTGFKGHFNRYHKIWWKNNSSFKKWMDICAEQSYNCEVCDEFFISKDQLDFHKLTHIVEQAPSVEYTESFSGPPFSCPKCKNSSHYEHWPLLKLHGYESHQLVFTNDLLETNDTCPSSYICHECRIPFTLRNRWVIHMEKIHNFIACSVGKCGEYFADEKLLHLHIKTNHKKSTSTAEFSCEHCEKKFCSVTSLWLHILVHIADGEKNIAPQNYETFFATLSGSRVDTIDENDLTSLESGPLPSSAFYQYHCENCKKKFKSFYALKIHELAQKIDDFSNLRKEDLLGKQFTCPECGINCQRNIVLREHCLKQHTIIVSTDAYPGEEFVKELLREKEYCKTISVSSCLDEREPSSSKSRNQCKRCFKIFMSYYNLMFHKSVQHMNVDTLERQVLGDKCHCPKCGVEFSKKSPGPLKMKVHCLSKHNLIVSGSESQLESFVQTLLSEKMYCDEHIIENTKLKQKSNLVKTCRLCDKVCSSIFAKKIHELAHTVDLATVEVENVEVTGTEELQCPRCQRTLFSNLELREHCLSTHNVIASTALVSGDEFIQFLREEQESIENSPKKVRTDEIEDNDSKNSDDDATKMDFIQEGENEQSAVAGTSNHTCSMCNKTFRKANVKFYHFLTHFQWKSMKVESIETPPPFTCTSCGESHRTFMSFREHCISAHGFNITNNYKGKTLSSSTSSETKIKSGRGIKTKVTTIVSEDGNEKFICDICGKIFNKRSVLVGHKRFVHKLEKSFICERCGAAFKSMNSFRFHTRVHFEKDNGIRPTCNICGKSYISSKGLSKHKTEYHPKKKLSCPICNKTFASREYANKHIKKHQELSQTGNKRWR